MVVDVEGMKVFSDILHLEKNYLKKMNLPDPAKLTPDGSPLPYVLVGDEAYKLTEYLVRPYPRSSLNKFRKILNYRLSRMEDYREHVRNLGKQVEKFEETDRM